MDIELENNNSVEIHNLNLNVKRITDLEYTPSQIESMSIEGKYMAISKGDGSIDLWDINDYIIVEKITGYPSK
jgi:hypothetical protein